VSSAGAPAQLAAILEHLLAATGASRTTLRLDWPAWQTHVDDVVAEARRAGVASLVGQTSIRQRDAATVRWLDRERRPLVQDDCTAADPAPPPELLAVYGVKAQMLAPVVRGAELVGWLSVHDVISTRRWSGPEVAALEGAAAEVTKLADASLSPT
jgi:maleate isomerase